MVEKKSCGLPGFFFTAEYKELGAELRGGRRESSAKWEVYTIWCRLQISLR